DGYETHAKTADLHRPSKGSLQVSDEIGMNPMSPHQKGGPYLQGHYRQGNGNRQLPPFSQYVHLASKSKGVSPKKVANQGKRQSDKPLMDGAQHPAPSRARRQMRKRVKDSHQPRPESAISTVIAALGLDRPINQERPPHNRVVVHESPEAAIP